MRFSEVRITNQDKLGQLLKVNRPLPTTAYSEAVNDVLSGIKNASQYSQQKKRIWTYAVSAALAIIGIGIATGYLFPNKPQDLIVTDTSAVSTVAPKPTLGEALTVKERVIEANEYGVVTLCTRSFTDVNMLMKQAGIPDEKTDQVQCYEDEKYLYFFNEDGTAAGVMAAYMNDSTFDPETIWRKVHLSEEDAIGLAKKALPKYCSSYTEETADRFKIETWYADADEITHLPWRLTFSEYTPSGIRRNTILVEIDMYGNVATILFGLRSNFTDEQLEQNKYISKESAIAFALEQFKKEERDVDLEHFTVTADLFEDKGKVNWMLDFKEIADESGEYMNGWRQCYWMVLDAITGEWISTSISR